MVKEDRLIRDCLRLDINQKIAEEVKAGIGPDLNWAYFINRARQEKVSPLIYKGLTKIDPARSKVPADIWQELESFYYASAARNSLLCENLNGVLSYFRRMGIEVILLKGIALIHTIYPDIALRPMDDMDILIKQEDLAKTNEALNCLGYFLDPDYKDFLRGPAFSSINALLYKPEDASHFFIHLHWHLINSSWPLGFLASKTDMKRIWGCAEPVKIGDTDSLTLSPKHLLIYLAQHGSCHYFSKLILLYDIARVLQYYKDRLNWELVAEEAKRSGLSYIVYNVLVLASKILNIEIPQMGKLRMKKYTLAQEVVAFFIRKGIRSYKLSYSAYFFLQPGFLTKIRFIEKTIFPSPVVLAQYFNLPVSEIRLGHYYRRFIDNFYRFLTLAVLSICLSISSMITGSYVNCYSSGIKQPNASVGIISLF